MERKVYQGVGPVVSDARLRLVIIALVLVAGLAVACAPNLLASPTTVPPSATPGSTATPAPTTPPTATPMAQPWKPGTLVIHVLAVDHGDAQLIVSPTGETMLIDGAREEYAPRIAQYLREVLGEVAVDYVLLSHYHVDHMQGIVPLLQDQGIEVRRAVLDRGGDRQEYDSDHYRAYYDYVIDPDHDLNRLRVRVGDQIDMGPEIAVEVLAVGDIDTDTNLGVPVIDDNDNCIALWLSYGEFDYWTAGDLTGVDSIRYADIETAVIPHLPWQVDVYRANHHAIVYNSNPAFLEALNPTVTLASTYHAVVGWETLLRLEEYGDVYITGRVPAHEAAGDIVLISEDGDSYSIEGHRYESK